MTNNKKRGNRVELEISKLLTTISGIQYHRVGVCSGARATKQKIKANGFVADIFTEDEKYMKLIIEVKGTKKNILISDIFNPKSLLNEWIKQCKREADFQDWLLIFKMSGRTPIFLCQHDESKEDILEEYNLLFKNSNPILYDKYWIGELKKTKGC